jgi:hypothetical protein
MMEKNYFSLLVTKKSWFLCLIVLLVKRLAPVSDFPERLVPYEEINCLEITTSKRGRHAYRLGEIVNNKKKILRWQVVCKYRRVWHCTNCLRGNNYTLWFMPIIGFLKNLHGIGFNLMMVKMRPNLLLKDLKKKQVSWWFRPSQNSMPFLIIWACPHNKNVILYCFGHGPNNCKFFFCFKLPCKWSVTLLAR